MKHLSRPALILTPLLAFVAACAGTPAASVAPPSTRGAAPSVGASPTSAAPSVGASPTSAAPSVGASPTSAAPSVGASPTSAEPVALTYAIWDKNQEPAMKQIGEAYTKLHPNVTINVETTAPQSAYFVRIENTLSGSNAPDVFWSEATRFIKLAEGKQILPLDDAIAAENVDLARYPKSLLAMYTYEGAHYGLPKDFDTIGLWYNKEFFDKAHVSYPDESWTWDTMRAAAEKLTDTTAGVYGIVAARNSAENFFNSIFEAGGSLVTADGKSGYNEPAAVEGIRLWTDLIQKGYSPTDAQLTETASTDWFKSGRAAMYQGGSWQSIAFRDDEYLKSRADVAVLPKGKQRGVVTHGLGNVVAAGTKHPNEAKSFALFASGKEAAQIQGSTGTVIPAYEGMATTWVESTPNFNLQAFIDQVEYATPWPQTVDVSWYDLQEDWLKKAWTGDVPVETAVAELAKAIDAVWAKTEPAR